MELRYFILIIWIIGILFNIIGKFYISYLNYKINEEIKDLDPLRNEDIFKS